MTNIEIIRNACIKANPEIMELKFGCKIKRRFEYYKIGTIIGEDNGTFYILYDGISQVIQSIYDIQDDEILGSEIRLSDVLLALKKKLVFIAVTQQGFFMDCINKTYISADFGWDLKNDKLELQSQETIDFIAGLLGGE